MLGKYSQLYRLCMRYLSMTPVQVRAHYMRDIAILLGVHKPYEPEAEKDDVTDRRPSGRKRSRPKGKGTKPSGRALREARARQQGNPAGFKNYDLLKARMAHARDPDNNPRPEAEATRFNPRGRPAPVDARRQAAEE